MSLIQRIPSSRRIYRLFLAVYVAITLFTSSTVFAEAPTIANVSTGNTSACAVVGGVVKCWGSNASGQLGNGTTGGNQSTPGLVVTNKDAIAAKIHCSPSPQFCLSQVQDSPAIPASALAGKYVEKVSVGVNHACAMANARVYCWGDNSRGQLGNRTNTGSSVPVAVDIQSKDITPTPVMQTSGCGAWWQPKCVAVAQPAKPKSGLGNKEVIDVAAGENFTCALSSDGTVACWGEGDNGRLGTGNGNSTTCPVAANGSAGSSSRGSKSGTTTTCTPTGATYADANYPLAIYSQSGSALFNKKAVKLAKVSGATMCVLAINSSDIAPTSNGNPYCWGFGVGSGVIPAGSTTTVACSSTSPTKSPTATSAATYFDTSKPVQISGSQVFSELDGDNYVSALGDDSRPYYWGMHGYKELSEYSNITSCVRRVCTGYVEGNIILAGGKYKTSSGQGGNGGTTHSTSGTPGQNKDGSITRKDNNNQPTCANVTNYGYTKTIRNSEIGRVTPGNPPLSSLTQSRLSHISGNVTDGLVCATTAAGTYCDAQGTSSAEGQTGSNYTKQCTTTTNYVLGFLVGSTTTCAPAPTGPQQVYTGGWLGGKSVKSLDTGSSGYTCALANNSVGCWGLNSSGQLGTGDTNNKNVPTGIGL